MITQRPTSTLFPYTTLFRSMQAMFYATPIFYTLDVVQEKTGSDLVPKILISNPFAAILQQFRNALLGPTWPDRKSTRLNSSHQIISYAVFCFKKKKKGKQST